MRSGVRFVLSTGAVVLVALLLSADRVEAVPSFARQLGVPCSTCHTVFPQLTPFGRNFKLRGYTMASHTEGETPRLQEAYWAPISLMLMTSYTSTRTEQPGTQNDDVLLPDQLSFFYAGRISSEMGTFLQITYDGVDDHFSMDNTDVRYAHQTSQGDLIIGATLNNNPTVEDLWNSTPAWGYPYVASPVAPAPAAAALIDGGLAQQVAGLGGLVSWKSSFYGLLAGYRSSQIGGNEPPDAGDSDIIDGVMPYWRLAWAHDAGTTSWEVGTYGLSAKVFPGGGMALAGATDHFLDLAVDGQVQWLPGTTHTITAHATWIHEQQDWDASFPLGVTANPSDTLRTLRISGTYYHDRKYGATLAYFSTTGDSDPLLYAPDPIDGSRTGSPKSDGFMVELDWVPWYNTKFLAQYTVYNTFNGAGSNYDGFGRDASNNNTLYVNLWFAF